MHFAFAQRQYLTLGHEHEGWDLAKAEVELQNVLADVRRGLWVLPKKKRRGAREWAESGEAQPFGPFAVELTKSRAGQVAEKTTKHERWALGHLVPFFGDWSLSEIDVEGVDEYRAFKVEEAGLREIEILPILRDILAVHRAIAYRGDPDALVFPTLTGARGDADSLRTRVLAAVFERADELLEQRGLVPLPT